MIEKRPQLFRNASFQGLHIEPGQNAHMGAGLATTQKEISIPKQQRIILRIVKRRQTFIAEYSRPRLPGAWSAHAGLQLLVGRKKRRKQRIIEIERRREEDAERPERINGLHQTRGVARIARCEFGKPHRNLGNAELGSEDLS